MTLHTYTKAKFSVHQPHLIAGAWKFLDAKKNKRFGVTTDELAETAIEMVNASIGKGRFVHVFVRGTGPDEIGLCFMYEATIEEMEAKDRGEDLKMAYIDFFRRRHGAAFKGYDIGTGVDVIDLAD